jgi:hypothetical protein
MRLKVKGFFAFLTPTPLAILEFASFYFSIKMQIICFRTGVCTCACTHRV